MPAAVIWSPSGSSPRARGAHRRPSAQRRVAGIIPACAGSTVLGWPARCSRRDHPRVRGEHPAVQTARRGPAGSSPRARGALETGKSGGTVEGIIPACAGSTPTCWALSTSRRDHPRVRGEHACPPGGLVIDPGSSPRARGALPHAARQLPERGIIPACAGSTSTATRANSSAWDHPRVRGEHVCSPIFSTRYGGSSPRARGARRTCDRTSYRQGIIPACAGSTTARLPCWCSRWGSSPRARGARSLHLRGDDREGIIPACAGSTAYTDMSQDR